VYFEVEVRRRVHGQQRIAELGALAGVEPVSRAGSLADRGDALADE
jgi:hypothetical protein